MDQIHYTMLVGFVAYGCPLFSVPVTGAEDLDLRDRTTSTIIMIRIRPPTLPITAPIIAAVLEDAAEKLTNIFNAGLLL